MKTNWQDPQTSEIRSTHISGLQEAIGKFEDILDMQLVAETNVPLTEVYISANDRYRIYQAPVGKRNWAASPAPVIYKNGVQITSGFTIDYGGGAIILSPAATSTDVFTADVSYVKTAGNKLDLHLSDTIPHGETVSKTIYVNVTTGSDITGDGTITKPYKTITNALNGIKRNLYVDVKIRVYPGDYTPEGIITIRNFSKGYIILTAFDGTNDIITVNDSYLVYKINVENCDKIQIQGFKITWNQAGDYGIFTSNTRFGYYIGIKNDSNVAVNNGFGVTLNSEVYLEGCLCANKDIVVSCNYGSRVVSVNWNAASTNNRIGLWAHGGSIIIKSGLQPSATDYTDYIDTGGKIIEETGHNRTYQTLVTIDATLTGTKDIAIDLPISPSWIKIDAVLTGSKEVSWGQWSRNAGTPSQSCIFRNNADTLGASYNIVELNNGASNIVQYKVDSVTQKLIRLAITKTGNPTGTIYLNVLCGS